MKNLKNQKISLKLYIKGFILSRLIEDRVKYPSLYTGNGSCRKGALLIAKDFLSRQYNN